MNCSTCDSTRTLKSDDNDCIPNSGYFENNLSVAGSCVGNCSNCTDNSSCVTCFTNYYYWSGTSNCLICTDIYPNCHTCN